MPILQLHMEERQPDTDSTMTSKRNNNDSSGHTSRRSRWKTNHRLFSTNALASIALIFILLVGNTAAWISPNQSHTRVVPRSSFERMGRVVVVPKDVVHSVSPHQQRHPSSLGLGTFGNDNNQNNSSPPAGDMDPSLKLLVCILIDFIGISSFAAPGLGEATDVGWAPISALLINYLFGNGVFTALALVEELSPGLDFIPTATIAWFLENANKEPTEVAASPPPSQGQQAPPPPVTRSSKPRDSEVIDVDVVE